MAVEGTHHQVFRLAFGAFMSLSRRRWQRFNVLEFACYVVCAPSTNLKRGLISGADGRSLCRLPDNGIYQIDQGPPGDMIGLEYRWQVAQVPGTQFEILRAVPATREDLMAPSLIGSPQLPLISRYTSCRCQYPTMLCRS